MQRLQQTGTGTGPDRGSEGASVVTHCTGHRYFPKMHLFGTHTMRKTFVYHLYINNKRDVRVVMEVLGHSSEAITLRYIGVEREAVNAAVRNLDFSLRYYIG